jgi:hypothetical protein
MTAGAPLRICAVGDISFEGPAADTPSLECFADVADRLQRADVTVANLECALTAMGRKGIPGKCTLRGSPSWAQVLKQAGVDLVTLANNHVMDFGPEGLFETMEALRRAGVGFVGAGRTRDEACAPVFMDLAQRRVAFLGRSAVIVSAPTYAAEAVPGVAFLDVEETLGAIRACRSRADLVVLLVHWGIEEYSYPSLAQRAHAKQFVQAGADLVLGHHPHVLQGAERIGSGMAVHSLGNFTFDEFEWSHALPGGEPSPQIAALSNQNRRGVIATFEWAHRGARVVPAVTTVFTRIGDRGRVFVNHDPSCVEDWRTLCAALEHRFYGTWWRWYAVRREWALRLGEQVSPSRILANLHRIRFRHVARALTSLLRSLRIVTEKTTNPYE